MSTELFSLKNRVVVITGAQGLLGRAYTAAVIAAGGRVAALDIVHAELPDYPAGSLLRLTCDVRDRAALAHALDAIQAHFNAAPYGLVNNAGLDSPPDAPAGVNGAFETYPESAWRDMLDVNLTGAMLCCQVFGGAIARAGAGSIVNIGSIYGVVSPDQSLYQYRRDKGEAFFKPAAYSASKAALIGLTRYLAAYWAGAGVRVNILIPAGVENGQDEAFKSAYTARLPLERMARPNEYDGSIIYLLSDASAYMTGSVMTVDGGWTAL